MMIIILTKGRPLSWYNHKYYAGRFEAMKKKKLIYITNNLNGQKTVQFH